MLKDRGRMKWTAMMLPEHVAMLREWAHEDSYESERLLDEQQLEEMNMTMGEALETGKTVTITYYEQRRYQLLIGTIHYYNETQQKLHVIDRFEQPHYIALNRMVDIRFTD